MCGGKSPAPHFPLLIRLPVYCTANFVRWMKLWTDRGVDRQDDTKVRCQCGIKICPYEFISWKLFQKGTSILQGYIAPIKQQYMYNCLNLKYCNSYAPGLKGPPGASNNRIVCPSVCVSVRNSVPITNKVQYLKFG